MPSRRPISPASSSCWERVPASACPASAVRATSARAAIRRTSGPAAALAIGLPQGNLLIDTPPDLRQQLLREKVGIVHAVLYTHEHADHLFGLDDLRLFPFYLGHPVPLYCEAASRAADPPVVRLRLPAPRADARRRGPAADVPANRPRAVRPARRQDHAGASSTTGQDSTCSAFGSATSPIAPTPTAIPPESMELLRRARRADSRRLRHEPHVTHFSLDEAIAVSPSSLHQNGRSSRTSATIWATPRRMPSCPPAWSSATTGSACR